MIKPSTILLLSLALFLPISNQLNIQVSSTTIESNDQWTRIQFEITGGEAPYNFFFTQIPTTWNQIKNGLYFPSEVLSTNRKYPAKLIVNDSQGNTVSATVVVNVKDSQVSISQTVFPFSQEFDDEFFEEQGFNGRPEVRPIQIFQERNFEASEDIEVIERTEEESEELMNTTGSGLQKIMQALMPENEENIAAEMKRIKELMRAQIINNRTIHSVQQVFSDLPTTKQLDQIIVERDSFTIFRTVQFVIRQENLSCAQKVYYISDFFGRILSAIKMKKFTLTQLQIIIDEARAQITRLSNEIQFLQSQIEQISLQPLQKMVFDELILLEEAYDIFNDNFQRLEAERAGLRNLQDRLAALQKVVDDKTNEIANKNEELTETLSDIERLERELQNARIRRRIINDDILTLEGQIRQLQFQRTILQRNIDRIQFTISQFRNRSDQLKTDYRKIEITVQRLRDDIKRGRNKEVEFFELIQDYKKQRAFEEGKIALRQLRILQNFIQALTGTVPNFEEEINKIYYKCFEAENVRSTIINGKVTYIISLQKFVPYIKFTYGAQVDTPSLSSEDQEISLTPFSILEDQWIQTFGEPYEDQDLANTDEFSFNTDFNCLNPSTLQNGSGTILSIQKNIIKVQKQDEDDEQIILTFSPCSRIQSATRLPKAGQTIYWKGNLNKNGQIQVYLSTSV